MQSWLAKQVLRYNMRRLNDGDIGPTLRLDADDVRFVFPGDNTWAGEFKGKSALRPWLERFAAQGIQIYADEVVVKGFPWRGTVCVRGHDFLRSSEGDLVYQNRYVIWGHTKWGRLKDYEVYEDTQKARAFDDYLTAHERPAVAS